MNRKCPECGNDVFNSTYNWSYNRGTIDENGIFHKYKWDGEWDGYTCTDCQFHFHDEDELIIPNNEENKVCPNCSNNVFNFKLNCKNGLNGYVCTNCEYYSRDLNDLINEVEK